MVRSLFGTAWMALASMLMIGCASYEDVTLEGVDEVSITSMDAQGSAIRAVVRVHNPNNFKITVQDPDVDLYINDAFIGKALLDSAVNLSPRSTETVLIPMHAQLQGAGLPILVFGLGAALGGEMRLRAEGTVVGRAGLLRKRFPFKLEERVEMDR
ncbi:MAG: LEA type 2 family protein [Flavobacteriales bacterium]|nr:LEA type 2 family protein [Flavobacteriales bacterium]